MHLGLLSAEFWSTWARRSPRSTFTKLEEGPHSKKTGFLAVVASAITSILAKYSCLFKRSPLKATRGAWYWSLFGDLVGNLILSSWLPTMHLRKFMVDTSYKKWIKCLCSFQSRKCLHSLCIVNRRAFALEHFANMAIFSYIHLFWHLVLALPLLLNFCCWHTSADSMLNWIY